MRTESCLSIHLVGHIAFRRVISEVGSNLVTESGKTSKHFGVFKNYAHYSVTKEFLTAGKPNHRL